MIADLSTKADRDVARFELERAHDDAALATWARKYGEAAMEEIDDLEADLERERAKRLDDSPQGDG